MREYNLTFHQTFPPSPELLMRLLEVCDTGTPYCKEEISARTGIPTGKSSGKVVAHIKYAEYMGLVQDEKTGTLHNLTKTPLGTELLQQDPGLQENVSAAVCHGRITSRYGGATLWRVMWKELLPRYPQELSRQSLEEDLQRELEMETPIKTAPFFSSYSGLFRNLSLLEVQGDRVTLRKGSIHRELRYAYGYVLLYEWEQAYPGQREITAFELEKLKIAETFGFDRDTYYELLEALAEKGIIRFNRQLVPYTVIQMSTSGQVIPKLYSDLC